MMLKILLQCLENKKGPLDIPDQEITEITADSRFVHPGCLFVAVRGSTHDGHDFLEQAAYRGAAALVGEKDLSTTAIAGVPYWRVPDASLALAQLSAQFYGQPSASLRIVGVTGTSGKTTTTFLIESILQAASCRPGLIGTVVSRFLGQEIPSTHTTPSAPQLQSLLRTMKNAGCQAVVMEVSSHGLEQKRSRAIGFDAVAFLNLSPEHLDFHQSMENYYQAKKLLFTASVADSVQLGKKPVLVVCTDDSWGMRLYEELKALRDSQFQLPLISVGADPQNEVSTASWRIGIDGIRGKIQGISFHSSLIGRFNAQNIAVAAAVARGLGIAPETIVQGIETLKGVPGRLEKVDDPKNNVRVYVDYAHKPDALEKVLQTLADLKGPHRLITVFGCGGNRDQEKRPIMGKIAAQWSDAVFVTSDNPRTEDPDAIIQQIVAGISGFYSFFVEKDRKRAIEQAVRHAHPGDIVLIAGKGHETYQIVGEKKIPFDDRLVAQNAMKSAQS